MYMYLFIYCQKKMYLFIFSCKSGTKKCWQKLSMWIEFHV